MKPILGFLLGCIITGAVLGIYANGLRVELRNEQNQVQSGLKQATQERDKCQDKFSRVTILYERPTNIFGQPIRNRGPLKAWTIPADLEPTYAGSSEGLFSHYDPNTQMETVKFVAKK
ncbi:MAG: hypothetical protein WA748_12830 [Candidatus Acidiferrum sp.]